MEPGLFPLGIAVGAAHCDRETERKRLADNVQRGRHTWLSARRRMGKTSLIEQVTLDLKRRRHAVVSVALDLLVVHDAEALEIRLRQAVSEATALLLPKNRRILDKLKKAFATLKPELVLSDDGVTLKLGSGESPSETVEAALKGLDRIASERKRRVMFVCDEFQQLATLKDHTALEGAVRHAAERTKHVAFVFAGSERHLLAAMFEDPDRPLYRLCDRMSLERIGQEHYASFLLDASRTQWKKPISEEAIKQILALTLRHPYYVNALCGRLWTARRAPSVVDVDAAWALYVEENKRRVAVRVLELSLAQRAMLAAIARQPTSHPASQEFLSKVRLPASTGLQAKGVLEREDLIQQNEDGVWESVDPVLATYLREI
jgi:hypothetical protein